MLNNSIRFSAMLGRFTEPMHLRNPTWPVFVSFLANVRAISRIRSVGIKHIVFDEHRRCRNLFSESKRQMYRRLGNSIP